MKNCSLRKYFLEEQLKNRKLLSTLTFGTPAYSTVYRRVYPDRAAPLPKQIKTTGRPKVQRDKQIIHDVDNLREAGYKAQDAFPIVAGKYFIQAETVRKIYYGTVG
jgi:hypothetical protein